MANKYIQFYVFWAVDILLAPQRRSSRFWFSLLRCFYTYLVKKMLYKSNFFLFALTLLSSWVFLLPWLLAWWSTIVKAIGKGRICVYRSLFQDNTKCKGLNHVVPLIMHSLPGSSGEIYEKERSWGGQHCKVMNKYRPQNLQYMVLQRSHFSTQNQANT